jgi:hypothetical protein
MMRLRSTQEEKMIFKLTVFAMAASLYYVTQLLH